MWIMGGNRNVIINSEKVYRFAVSKKEDCVLIFAAYGTDDGNYTNLARYQTEQEAYNELCDLCDAMKADLPVYFMKTSTGVYKSERDHERYHGKKPIRYGGS